MIVKNKQKRKSNTNVCFVVITKKTTFKVFTLECTTAKFALNVSVKPHTYLLLRTLHSESQNSIVRNLCMRSSNVCVASCDVWSYFFVQILYATVFVMNVKLNVKISKRNEPSKYEAQINLEFLCSKLSNLNNAVYQVAFLL